MNQASIVAEYEQVYWPQLCSALDTVLLKEPGSYQPISYEQMYSAVYKCVCKQYSDRLYSDVMDHIGMIVGKWASHLTSVHADIQSDNELPFVKEFHSVLTRYFHALSSIVPIFTYMNRFYVEGKLHSDLRQELLRLFTRHVPRFLFERLVGALVRAQDRPFSILPAIVQSLIQNLHLLNPEFSSLAPELFSRHLVGIQAPMIEEELEAQRIADRALQDHLRITGFNTSDSSRKRLNPDFDPHQQFLNSSS